jgi:hypothetical protein
MDWSVIVKALGGTAMAVAAFTFIAKEMIKHFFSWDLERHKANLKQGAEKELQDLKARYEVLLLSHKSEFDRQMEAFRSQLMMRTAAFDRIRQEISRWANPILGAIEDLCGRIHNILHDGGYLALSQDSQDRVEANWSIDYEYFMVSSVYLFCQYFCVIRMLEKQLSFELFKHDDEKDSFFEKIWAVGEKLSSYPLPGRAKVTGGRDIQVFKLQQRALGEILISSRDDQLGCMQYSEFLENGIPPSSKDNFNQ